MLPTILDFVLGSHFPPLLLPSVTFAIVGFIVALRSSSKSVSGAALSWCCLGAVGVVMLYVIPFLEPFLFPGKPSPFVLFVTAFNETMAEIVGDNLISNVWLEVGAVAAFISSSGTAQESVKSLAKWLWRLFGGLFVLTLAIRMYMLLKQRNVI